MTMQELIDYLKQNEEIGRNRPTSEVKIAIGVLKLKEAGFPNPPPNIIRCCAISTVCPTTAVLFWALIPKALFSGYSGL